MTETSLLTRFFAEVAEFSLFTWRVLRSALKPPYEFAEFTRQCYLLGYKSFPLVAITALIIGLVMTIQSRPTLAVFGAESWLPAMVSISIIREIGPIITALICAGKIGSGMGAEISSMKVSEQIDAMEVSGVNPFKYLVVTRVLAATLMVPMLVILGDAVSIGGAYIGVNLSGDVSLSLYFAQIIQKLSFSDVIPALLKTVLFGFAIGLVGCYHGYRAEGGTRGVGRAANASVVLSSVLVFFIDGIVVQISSGLGL